MIPPLRVSPICCEPLGYFVIFPLDITKLELPEYLVTRPWLRTTRYLPVMDSLPLFHPILQYVQLIWENHFPMP
jgi:hypothetical protein